MDFGNCFITADGLFEWLPTWIGFLCLFFNTVKKFHRLHFSVGSRELRFLRLVVAVYFKFINEVNN